MAVVQEIVSSTGVTIVKCIVRWLYTQSAELLRKLKDILLGAIAFIDRQIDTLKIMLAQADILAKGEEFLWNIFEGVIQQLKDTLFGNIPGPDEAQCPEFYEFIMAPMNLLLGGYTDVFSIYRERWKSLLSFMDEINLLLSYWENTKAYLLAMVEVMDDAIYMALETAASAAEQAAQEGA